MNRRRVIIVVVSAFLLLVMAGIWIGKARTVDIRPPVTAEERVCAFHQVQAHLDNPFQRIALALGSLEIIDRTRRDFTVVARTAFGVPFAAVVVYDCPGDLLASMPYTPELAGRYLRTVEIFTKMRSEFARAADMPEGGYLPSHFLAFYPGLKPQDFDGIEAEGGGYALEDGVLVFDEWASGAEAWTAKGAALGTLSKFDMGRVFDTAARRTGIDWVGEDGVAAFMNVISATDETGEGVVLYDADGVRVSERPRASSRYRTGNVETMVDFRDLVIAAGAGDPVVIPYRVYNVGLSSVRTVTERNIVLAYGDGFPKTSEFWIVNRELGTVTRHATRPHFGQWLTVTSNGGIVYRTGDAIVVADAAWHEKKRILFTDGESVVVAAMLSEDGNRLALVTWNGVYEQSEAKYLVHVIDIATGDVTALGEVAESNVVVWDGGAMRVGRNEGRAPKLARDEMTGMFTLTGAEGFTRTYCAETDEACDARLSAFGLLVHVPAGEVLKETDLANRGYDVGQIRSATVYRDGRPLTVTAASSDWELRTPMDAAGPFYTDTFDLATTTGRAEAKSLLKGKYYAATEPEIIVVNGRTALLFYRNTIMFDGHFFTANVIIPNPDGELVNLHMMNTLLIEEAGATQQEMDAQRSASRSRGLVREHAVEVQEWLRAIRDSFEFLDR